MIAIVELVGEESVHRRLIRFANVVSYLTPRIERRNQLSAVVEHAAERPRHLLIDRKDFLGDISFIATEKLVAAVAGKHDIHTGVFCHFQTKVSRYGRAVAEGFVIGGRHCGHRVERFFGPDNIFVGESFEMLRRDPGVMNLVVSRFFEADRKSLGRLGAALAH